MQGDYILKYFSNIPQSYGQLADQKPKSFLYGIIVYDETQSAKQ